MYLNLQTRLFQIALALSVLATTNRLHANGEEQLFWHPVRLDGEEKLLSWPEAGAPYDEIVCRAWGAFEEIPVQPNGFRTYLTYPVFFGPKDNEELFSGRSWTHNPASLFAMLTDGGLLYYAYSGDQVVLDRIREILDHHIAYGTTTKIDAWSRVPFASSDAGQPYYRGATDTQYEAEGHFLGRGDGVGFLEPDKVGELGRAYLQFYEVTGEEKYLEAARHCADALVRHIRPGDESHSPWPFRVDAATGRDIREEYTANVIGPIRLLEEMVQLGDKNTESYESARQTAWRWLMKYPVQNNVWSQYFEDIYIYPDYRTNINQYIPLETARYLMQHPERDPQWREHAKGMIDWVQSIFAQDSHTMAGLPEEGIQWGAEVISEQVNDMDKMTSHTARYASVLALWYEKTGDRQARERAFRSFNWASYGCREDGLVKTSVDEGTGYWFSDGYGDYMRHFSRGMASVPEWAPSDEDHLHRSSSVVRSIKYGEDSISYRVFHDHGNELLKLRQAPLAVRADGKALEELDGPQDEGPGYTVKEVSGGGYAVRITRTNSNEVEIQLGSQAEQ